MKTQSTTKVKKSKAKTTEITENVIHLAGIPCKEGTNKPIIDPSYSYNKANVTCPQCFSHKR